MAVGLSGDLGALLDTSVLAASEPIDELPETAAISVVTLGELRAGVLLARTSRIRELRLRRLEAVRTTFLPLVVDEPIGERYGDILALARSRRRTVKASDLLIVATAAATSRTLFTLDRSQAALAEAAGVPAAHL